MVKENPPVILANLKINNKGIPLGWKELGMDDIIKENDKYKYGIYSDFLNKAANSIGMSVAAAKDNFGSDLIFITPA